MGVGGHEADHQLLFSDTKNALSFSGLNDTRSMPVERGEGNLEGIDRFSIRRDLLY